MKKRLFKLFVLLAAIVVFFGSLAIAHCVETSGGAVGVKRLAIETNDNAMLSAKIWHPKTATAETPAPAVILIPGGNANLEYMSATSIELARRGYVALAIDPYTIGRSDVISPTSDLGGSAALSYIKSLNFVDQDAIGMIGWSAGVGRATAASILPDGTPNGVKALFGFGAGSPGDPELTMNQGYFIGQVETTYGQGRLKQKDINTAEAFTVPMGTDYVEFATWYGDLAANKGRILYTGLTGHTMGLISGSGISAACSFFNDALKTAPTPVDNFAYGWKELFTALAIIALFTTMIMAGTVMLETAPFASLKRENVPQLNKTPSLVMWIMLGASILFGALIAKWAVFNGQNFLNKTGFLQIANANGFLFWLMCLALFAVVMLVVRIFADKTLDKPALAAFAKISVADGFKSLLLAFLVLFSGYVLVSLSDQFFNLSPRFWKVQLNVLNATRLRLMGIYFLFYIIPMLIFNYMHTSSYCYEDKPVLSTVLVWMANTLPALLFVIYVYGKIRLTGLTPITNAAMSRANGSMLDAVMLMLPVSIITAHFFRKTKNFYIAAFFNALFFAWNAVGTDLITFLG